MKTLLTLLLTAFYLLPFAQSVGIGTPAPNPHALLHLESNDKGLLLPNLATSTRIGMAAPPSGLVLFDYNTKSLWLRGATDWQELVTDANNVWTKDGGNIYRSTGFVGIGTSAPYNKLQVHSNLSDSNFLRITNNVTGSGPGGLITGLRGNNAALLNLENGNFFLGTNNDSIVTLSHNRRVGIGAKTPLAKLHINGSGISSNAGAALLITDSLPNAGGLLKFKQANNTTGMSLGLYSGGGFNNEQFLDLRSDSVIVATFAGNGRLGIRNLSPSYTLDVAGDINTNGTLRINGNAGTAGQVLTSNGTADPSWQTLTENYPAADRLMVPIAATPLPSALTQPLNFGTPKYNLNPSNFTVGSTAVTINTTGFYEIEGTVSFNTGNVTVASGNNPYGVLFLRSTAGAVINDYSLIKERIDQFSAVSVSFLEVVPYKMRLHITAGTSIALRGLIYQYSSGSALEIEEGYMGIVRIN